MSEIKDGGPAFPTDYPIEIGTEEVRKKYGSALLADVHLVAARQTGLTKREWFAGMALSGNIRDRSKSFEDYAKDAFKFADAMIQESEAKP